MLGDCARHRPAGDGVENAARKASTARSCLGPESAQRLSALAVAGVVATAFLCGVRGTAAPEQRGAGDTRLSPAAASAPSERPRKPRPDRSDLGARIEYYTSRLDGEKRPYGFCEVGPPGERKALLVCLMPGADSSPNPDALLRNIEEAAARIKSLGQSCVLIRPSGRGPGSRYVNYGEVDALEAIEDACRRFSIDRDRIGLFGHSMGGAAVWYLAAHYPDRFACAVPTAGYCDYRLWEKAGGYTFPLAAWEEPSWQARCAALLVDNFAQTPVWIWHGALDRALGGGVPVEHARQMHRLLTAQGFPVKYTEVPGEGHHFITPFKNVELMDQYLLWMLSCRKERNPSHVTLVTYWLRHNQSYWVEVDQLRRYGKRSRVDARISDDLTMLQAATENVRSLSLGPIPNARAVQLRLDDQEMGAFDLTRKQTVHWSQAGWNRGARDVSLEKRPGRSGPLSDLFFENVIYVGGSTGSGDENYFTQTIAGFMEAEFRRTNGGVHRGGIPGENSAVQRVALDKELTEDEARGSQLILFGTERTNALVARYIDRLPLKFGDKSLELDGKTFAGDDVALFALFPHPDNPERCLAIHGGVSPDAIVYGSHLNQLLAPDYLVYNRGQILAWGFWNNEWKMDR
jgi:pimeloyl-ACP methyl ester carboxylesterase